MSVSPNRSSPLVASVAVALLFASAAAGQTPSPEGQATSAPPETTTRPATTTFLGDTGLWFVPTADVLPAGQFSVSGYRRGTNYIQGYTNVADFAGTFAVGVRQRMEIFGSLLADTRIDRDTRPLLFGDRATGGIISRYPFVHQGWTADHLGDLYLGAKVNLWSQTRGNPLGVAVRGIVKLPTGNTDAGVSTGKPDVRFDFIGSREAARLVEMSGFAGYEYRGSPDGVDAPTGAFNWGAGASFPSRSPLRMVAELNGIATGSTATITTANIVGIDGSRPPITSNVENLTRATVGATLQLPKGFFVGGGISWNLPRGQRNPALTVSDDTNPLADYIDWQVRIGYHPGVRGVAARPAAVATPQAVAAPPAASVVQNRPPTVKAQCDPCTVEVGKTSTVTADGRDPDGDMLAYRWSAPVGALATPGETRSLWTAPQQEGPVPVTVTVNDGKGGTASDTVTIQVTRPMVARTYTFEDVHFDFDRYTLRPEATRVLDDAVHALAADAALRISIEGHTCNIGTAEYNLALGNRRADAVRAYLVERGVASDRLRTVSYGEERPKYDNAREETRRLNRRAALVVRIQ